MNFCKDLTDDWFGWNGSGVGKLWVVRDPFDGTCRLTLWWYYLAGLTDASRLTDCSQVSYTECMNEPTINPTCLYANPARTPRRRSQMAKLSPLSKAASWPCMLELIHILHCCIITLHYTMYCPPSQWQTKNQSSSKEIYTVKFP